MNSMGLHKVTGFTLGEVEPLRASGRTTYVRHFTVHSKDRGDLDIVMFADDKESLMRSL